MMASCEPPVASPRPGDAAAARMVHPAHVDPTAPVTRDAVLTARLGPGPALPETRPPTAPPGFHLLAKPTGAVCNLDCTYCFFLSKEALYPGSRFRMADDLLELYIKQLLEAHQTPTVTIAWQGGEPTLMGLDFFRRSIELVERYRRPDQAVEHTIQTNGTRIDEDWCAFFREHRFLLGLSMDGPPDVHDKYRVDKGGAPTHHRVLAAARRASWRSARNRIVEASANSSSVSVTSASALMGSASGSREIGPRTSSERSKPIATKASAGPTDRRLRLPAMSE